jgi:hypothetical protein
VGGIESVTLSDEEARRRGTQKTVLERRAAPTFDVLIEIQDRERLAVHHDVAAAVDAMLRGRPLQPELRYRDASGTVRIEKASASPGRRQRGDVGYRRQTALPSSRALPAEGLPFSPTPPHMPGSALPTIRIYAYGVARNRMRQAAKRLHVPAQLVEGLGEAEVMVTLRSYFRRRLKVITEAEARRLPIYVLRSNTVGQMEGFLSDLYNLQASAPEDPNLERAIEETREAIQSVLNGARSVDLTPASSYVRRLQHQRARQANLISHSYGKEPKRRVRIFRD